MFYMDDLQKKIDKYISTKTRILNLQDTDDYQFKLTYSKMTSDSEHLVDIYKNNKLHLRSTYEILGCYNLISSIWIWSWNISQVERDLTIKANEIKKYSRELPDLNLITRDIEEYYFYGTNPSFFISYNSLDRLLKFSEYITKSIAILPRKIDLNNPIIIEYILLKKIIQLTEN